MHRLPDKNFPDNFLWGAATSAYQVEGSPLADGAGPSIWHGFSHTPGRILNGDTGDMACDHYRRYREDAKLMRRLGLDAYRFSIAWPRVLPKGRGGVNTRGLDFYQRLVDALLEQGIEPFVTLYHWDLPLALDEQGGWLNRDSAFWFADYAEVLFRALDDRVRFWTTLNEPWVIADRGYLRGVHAPGHANISEVPMVSHNLLRAHGLAVQAYRAWGQGRIGIAINLEPQYPASEKPEDLAATRRAHAYLNRQYLDPVFFGVYPKALHEIFGEAWTRSLEVDLKLIEQPLDFLGINYYTRSVIRHDLKDLPTRASPLPPTQAPSPSIGGGGCGDTLTLRGEGPVYTELGWEVYPQGLTESLLWVKKRYGDIPLYLTENGAAFPDPPAAQGCVEDPLRLAYLRDHLQAAHTAIQAGVDLRGYFVWSLLDNFEWNQGYSKRFGIVHVDFATQKRTLKDSAYFYARVIRTQGVALSATPTIS